jgi:hypothetical protein
MTKFGDYRPAFVTQRDGSALANSNCRMASIAMGLAYEASPQGSQTSTGSKMRSYTDDQSGGTDSGDARQAWDRGYSQGLRVMDGHTFSEAIADLKAGRAVHLDVWHAKVGGPCLSGSGAYGHTILVLPDVDERGWAVGDPWCTPEAAYAREPESALRAGAEYWGGQVYSRAALEPDYPTGGPSPADPRVVLIVARIVKRLMDRWYPGHEATLDELEDVDPGDTGGGAILYTTTRAVPVGGADVPGMMLTDVLPEPGKVTLLEDGPVWRVADDGEVDALAGAVWTTTGTARYHHTSEKPEGSLGRMIRARAEDGELHIVANSRVTFAPTAPPTGDGDCTDDVAEAVAARDAAWTAHLTPD